MKKIPDKDMKRIMKLVQKEHDLEVEIRRNHTKQHKLYRKEDAITSRLWDEIYKHLDSSDEATEFIISCRKKAKGMKLRF